VHAVFIATPHDVHAEQAVAALRGGKHVFVEKPLAIDAGQLAAFEDAIDDLGAPAPLWTVGFNRRFSAAARRVVAFFSGLAAPRTLTYRMNAGAVAEDHWTQHLDVGGGRLVGEACHALDLASYLVGGRIVRVFTEALVPGGSAGAGDDQAVIVARFDNGAVASIAYFAGGDRALPKERIEVFGGGRVAVIDDFAAVTLAADGRVRRHRTGRDKGHRALVEAFVSAVRTGGPPPIPYAALLNVSWAALAATESLRTGVPVPVRGG
jgi:predicted dehydrogenase